MNIILDILPMIPVVALTCSILVNWRKIRHPFKQDKELSWQIVSMGKSYTVHPALKQMDEGDIPEYCTVIRFTNTGKQGVSKSDYEDGKNSLVITIGENDGKIEKAIFNGYTKDSDIQFTDKKVQINPLMMNPSDIFDIAILTNNPTPTYSVSGSILDTKIKKKTPITARSMYGRMIIGAILYALAGSVLSMIADEYWGIEELLGMGLYHTLVISLVCVYSYILGAYYNDKYKWIGVN